MIGRRSRTTIACSACLAFVLCAQQITGAQQRAPDLVTRAELRSVLRAAAERRDPNLQKIRGVLGHEDVVRIAGRVTDLTRLSRSLTTLDDRTLERLAVQSDAVSEQLHGEGVGKVLLIIALVLVILAVVVSMSLPESS